MHMQQEPTSTHANVCMGTRLVYTRGISISAIEILKNFKEGEEAAPWMITCCYQTVHTHDFAVSNDLHLDFFPY